MVTTRAEVYAQARKALQRKYRQDAARIARDLVCHVAGIRREELLSSLDAPADEATCHALERAVRRMLDDEPLAYVLGEWEFYGLPLYVDPSVLIPRDDTCAVTALAIQAALYMQREMRVLDLCAGSGCIGLAVADRVKDARVTLADCSMEALSVAKKNAARNKLSGRVSCVQVDALEPPPAFLGKFDLIVANPPYVTTREMSELPDSVKNYEPHLALDGGEDGLRFYRAIIAQYCAALKAGGCLCLEFGMGQAEAVCALLRAGGFTVQEIRKDYNERERAVLARYGG